ncbi:MAG: DUF5808 domain-containing protein [Pseudolysinimonas sp.]
MTAFLLIFSLVLTALLGCLLAFLPTLMPPGLPLGVRVPQAHAKDEVVRLAIRRFRVSLVAAWLVTAIVTVVVTSFGATPLAASLPILLFVALGLGAMVLSRRIIVRAKREGDWFAGIPVRVSAEITPVAYHHPPLVLPLLAAVVLAVATSIDVALYPTLPDPIATHYGISGAPDAFAPKSIWSVFAVLIIGAAVVALLVGLSFVAARYSMRPQPDDSAKQATLRIQAQRHILTSLLSELAFVLALGLSAIEVGQRLLPGVQWVIAATSIGLVVLVVLVVASTMLRARSLLRPANAREGQVTRPDGADDDAHWKGGFLYVNRDDPALFVPRRFGFGWTVNLGRPGGAVLGILSILVIAGAIVAAVLGVRAR